ncbi:MAG TPA: hypothetical protein PK572_11695, partial [Kiritimatiellia bacterium]|nr:hypothetical protein [Kiritimatiellia bacterium]
GHAATLYAVGLARATVLSDASARRYFTTENTEKHRDEKKDRAEPSDRSNPVCGLPLNPEP